MICEGKYAVPAVIHVTHLWDALKSARNRQSIGIALQASGSVTPAEPAGPESVDVGSPVMEDRKDDRKDGRFGSWRLRWFKKQSTTDAQVSHDAAAGIDCRVGHFRGRHFQHTFIG